MLSSKSIAASLEQARKELLDLGLRNSLLNYRAPKSRGVEVSNGNSGEVFNSLVTDKKAMDFLPVPDKDALGSDLAIADRAAKVPVILQTGLTEASLKSRLLATYLAAQTHIEERGSNILFLALGMLHWYEAASSDKEMRAPLVLVPVELKRTTARERFTLSATDEDIEDNLSLATKLRTEFRLRFPDLPAVEDLDLARYFDEVATSIADMKRWRVARDEISLGFFSFGKFLMYRDLAAEQWVDPTSGEGPPLLGALLRDGFQTDPSPVGEDQYLDSLIAPDAMHQVVDVDSSQALALLDIRAGRHLVIQGPPGTGKSQTITNVIADAVGQGKKVLFVAEKMAALEVVKRRLDKAGVGDACLELHSHTANKKALLGELKRTLQLGRPHLPGGRFNLGQYSQLRDQLTAYCQAVNEPVGETEFTPYQVMGELVAIRRALGTCQLPRMAANQASSKLLARSELERLASGVSGLERHLTVMGKPAAHPHRHSGLTSLLPSERQQIESDLKDLARAAQTLQEATQALGEFMGLAVRLDSAEAEVLAKAGRRAMSAPHLRDVEISASDWQERRDDIRELLETGAALSALHDEFDSQLIPEAWTTDLLAARQILMTTGQKWWRVLSGEYRRARNQIVGLCAGNPVRDVAGQLKIVEAVLKERRLATLFEQHASLGERLFGVQWQGRKSDWTVLTRISEWIVDLYRAIGAQEIPSGVVDFLAGNPRVDELTARVEAVETALPVFAKVLPAVEHGLALAQAFTTQWRLGTLEDQEMQVGTWLQTLDRLPEWITYNNLTAALRRVGFPWLIDAAADWEGAARHLTHFFRHVTLEGILREAHAEREALRTFSGVSQEHARQQFAELDRTCFAATQLQLATRHWESLPRSGGAGQLGLLLREFEKKSRHLPIRRLMKEAGNAIQAIKPVFMMSPMSIASFVPPGAAKFDLVVFDEASQVKPVDAFGAVLRGEQLVVVGDSKQLPPTSFFDSLVAADADPDEDEDANVTADMESILGLVAGQGAPQRMLRWHYRSRHQSLIALSNKEFYDSRLVVFPSPEDKKPGLGLFFHHMRDSVYDRGRSRTNRIEAQAVARAVIQHAHKSPHLTLGVAAFSLTQADAIIDELEKLRAGDRVAEAFFSKHPFEPFFVKNLESVQGDERDVILISIGYGKDANGYLAMSFGALNGNGGERRLNVLITRARLSCEVFSNITHDDIDLARTQARGVVALKSFLKYAASGILDVPDVGRADHDSVFEEQVADALESVGHQVAAQVGSGGFRIDLAVIDAERPGRYLVGIECDGATYHSSRSARDRDRLREQVLSSLGWRIHRIWSTDWFNDPERELKRALAAVEEAKTWGASPEGQAMVSPSQTAPEVQRVDSVDPPPQSAPTMPHPYALAQVSLQLGDRGLHEVPEHQLIPLIAEVARVEGPVHVSEVMRRIADAVGVKRIGSRIEQHLDRLTHTAARRGDVRREGQFISVPGAAAKPRDRSQLPAASRKIELIAPEEIAIAIKQVVAASYGISHDEIQVSVARMFGFTRASADIAGGIDRIVAALIERRELEVRDGQVRAAGS